MSKNNGSTTAEQARALIEADREARAQGATIELNEFLKGWGEKWRAQLVPVWVVRGSNSTHTIEVIVLE